MGKSKKLKISKSSGETDKYSPLADQILHDKSVRAPGRTKVRQRNEEDDEVLTAFRISSVSYKNVNNIIINVICDAATELPTEIYYVYPAMCR